MDEIKVEVKKDYLEGLKQKKICAKYDISINTLKSWIKRYKWAEEKRNKGAPNNKRGAPFNNKNSVGHGAPISNKNAEKFGFFSKHLPKETLDLMKEISEKNQLDILWEQITIQYAAIIRAQHIMYVENKEEMIKELKKEETSEYGQKIEYEFQFAWDRQATFLNAQSRAMGELRSLIKQYETMVNANWELVTEEQKTRIKKIKQDIDYSKSRTEVEKSKIVNNEKNKEDKIDEYFTKLEKSITNAE
ncbi:phage terminase small subunit [Paraclostridium bifermentans]|uniref:phage terminase small subunit n=1 Tax=Paraclostridium bifermentans TaxID=1490 RepID=UPI0022E561A8|nr:phage terminase small subunit [Paraclostridium bifermentans]